MARSQIAGNSGETLEVKGGSALVTVTGSYAILKGEPKPAGKQDETLLEYDVATKETKVYKFISGAWREL